jgi:hypothetical protein
MRWDGARSWSHLAVDERGDGEVPRRVGGHAEPQEGPHPVVVEGRDEHRGRAAGAEDVRPCPLVQTVVDVVDVAAKKNMSSSLPSILAAAENEKEEAIDRPGAGDQLDDGAEEQERAVEGETGRLPVRAQQPVQHFEPLANITTSLPLANNRAVSPASARDKDTAFRFSQKRSRFFAARSGRKLKESKILVLEADSGEESEGAEGKTTNDASGHTWMTWFLKLTPSFSLRERYST